MKSRRIIAILVVLTFVTCALLTGCNAAGPAVVKDDNKAAKSNAPSEKQMVMGACVMDMTNEYFTSLIEGYDKFVELTNGKVKIESYDGQNSPTKQVSVCEDLISKHVDAILLNAIDAAAVLDVINKALGQGILVSQYPDREGLTSAPVFDEYDWGTKLGKEAGKWINEKLSGKATVATFAMMELETVKQRWQGIHDGITSVCKEENITFVEPVNTINQDEAYSGMEAILQAHPECRVALATTDGPAIGAYEAITAAGKDSDDWFVGGCDGISQALDLIKKGGIYRCTAAQRMKVPEVGFWMAENLARAHYGLKYDRVTKLETYIVTAQNIDEHINRAPVFKVDEDLAKVMGLN